MLRTTLVALLAVSPVLAQDVSSYLSGLAAALGNNGLNQFANATQKLAGTPVGQQLLSSLPGGNNTVFVPNDNAFKGRMSKNISDPNVLAAVISYHVVPGSFSASNLSSTPGRTILRTHLNASQYVTLEGNRSQVLAVTNDNGTLKILEQNNTVQVVSSTTFQNLIIHVIDSFIDIPPRLADVFSSSNFSLVATAANQSGILNAVENMHGITIFAPTNQAYTGALQALGGTSKTNTSAFDIVLGNHIINGTSVYSTQFNDSNYISASGEPFKFSTNSSGTYVTSGPTTAKIVGPDMLTSNGVIHVIDTVLLNTQNNSAAASSALASATSVAAQSSGQTGVVGAPATASATSAKKNNAVGLELPVHELTLVLMLMLGGGAMFVL